MKLQYAITLNDPKSVDAAAAHSFGGKSPLGKVDVLTALGYLQSKEGAGLALIYAKYTKDSGELSRAVQECSKMAVKLAGKLPVKERGKTQVIIAQGLARLAVAEFSRTADTPGAKCRCGGRGYVTDEEKLADLTTNTSKPVEAPTKLCPRCRGTGLKSVPSSRVYRAVAALAPTLSERTFYRQWQGLYNQLLAWCYTQEERAELAYSRLTREAAREEH